MNPLKGAMWLLGAVVAAFLLLWGYRTYQSAQDAKVAAWKAKAETAQLAADTARAQAARTDTLYRQGETVYVRGREILLNPGPGKPPATAEVKACFVLSDTLQALCNRRHQADTAALHATERELAVWKNKPSDVRRFQMYGEALYDFANTVPVIRAGATAKIPWVPIQLSIAGEYAAPPAGESKPAFRALAGVRVTF